MFLGDMGADIINLPAEDITVDYCRRALAHAEREHWSLERLLTGPEYDYLFGFDGYRERSMEDLATVPPDDKASFVFELQFCAFSVLDYHDLLMALGGDRLADGGAAGAVAAAAEPAALAAAPPPPAGGTLLRRLLRRSSVGRNGGNRAPDWAAHMWSLVHLLITVLGYSLLSGRARTSMECVVATSICLVPLDGGLCATDYDRAAHRREASIIKDHCVGILSSSWACTVISGDCGRNICFLSGSS